MSWQGQPIVEPPANSGQLAPIGTTHYYGFTDQAPTTTTARNNEAPGCNQGPRHGGNYGKPPLLRAARF